MKSRRTRKAIVGKAMSSINRKLHDVRVLAVIITVVLSILIAIILGTLLGKKADESSQNPGGDIGLIDPDGTSDPEGSETEAPEIPNVIKKAKDITADFSEVSDFDSDYKSSYSALSLTLRNPDGSLEYNSAVAEKYGFDRNGYSDLSKIVSLAESKNKYLSVCFYLAPCEDMSESERLVYRAYELALIEELSAAGVDDILIFGLDLSEKAIDMSVLFVSEAQRLVEKTYIGVASSYRDVDRDEFSYSISKIYEEADYIAIDYSEFAEDEEGFYMALAHSVYYHTRYYARALFTEKSTAVFASQKALLAENGIKNYQIIYRTAAG